MSGSPPNGTTPGAPVPPRPTSVAQSDHGAGKALAGLICAVASILATLTGAAFAAGFVPDRTSGEGLLVMLGAFVLALVGLFLSLAGRHSTSRRRHAVTGIVLSCIGLAPFVLAITVTAIGWIRCAPHCI